MVELLERDLFSFCLVIAYLPTTLKYFILFQTLFLHIFIVSIIQYSLGLLSNRIPSVLDENGAFFIDRDPDLFSVILNFLRTKNINLDGVNVTR